MSSDLPIEDVRPEFEDSFETTSPTIVAAPTGSGKSTRLPVWLDELTDDSAPVLVVEPRRVACRSLAKWVSQDYSGDIGDEVGYRIRFDDSTSDSTQIIFATTGTAIRMLSENPADAYGAVLIDEFHERQWQVDLLLTSLRQRRARGEDIPLVLTSATLDIDTLAAELEADVIEAEGRTYPVDIEYHGDKKAPTKHALEPRVQSAVSNALTRDDGDILIFLPGKGEISDCFGAVASMSETDGVNLYKVHAQMPPHKIDAALSEDEDRCIYFATNIAETSLTLPGVTTVIDSGLARMKIHRGGESALAMVAIAEDSMDQRAGRAGRVQPGRCIRLWSERFTPKPTTPPQIERIELDDVLLHAGQLGLNANEIEDYPWVTDPPEFAIEESRRRLKNLGAFDDNGELTTSGEQLAAIPVEGHNARLLVDAPDEYLGVLCDLTAVLELNGDLFLSNNRDDRIRENRRELVGADACEPYALIKALRGGDSRQYRLNSGALREARRTASQLRDLSDAEPSRPTDDTLELPDISALAEYLLDCLPDKAFVLRKRARKKRGGSSPKPGQPEPWTNGNTELKVWPYRPPGARESDDISFPTAGLILDQFWVGRGYSNAEGMGSKLLPVDESKLADAGIGETTVAHPSFGDHYSELTVQRQDRLEKVVLRSEETTPTGKTLCQLCAELIADRDLWPDTGEQLAADFHIWEILIQWPEPDRYWNDAPEPPDLVDYLEDKLERLGLNHPEELELIEAEDLRPDVESKLDIMSYDVDSFREDFPLYWNYQGGTYRCSVEVGAETVFLEPVDNAAKEIKEPKARHVPKFRGFSVLYRRESRTVPLRT
jgi:ATP-dependent helicase HrpB